MDLIIRNATIVDGTGSPGRRGDLGITDGFVAAISSPGTSLDGTADREIDAEGLVVTPGFVDPHTHYDAQLLWDPSGSPSNVHGVTTVIAGNCGFTLAPIKAEDADYTRRMMAKVEGMPLLALETGVDWNWSSFEEYLSRLDGNLGMNAGFLVGHCAIRRMVMGTEAVEAEPRPNSLTRCGRCSPSHSRLGDSDSPPPVRGPTPMATTSRCLPLGIRR